MRLQYKLPAVCVKCGIKRGEVQVEIKSRTKSSFYLVAVADNYAIFSVPICNSCKTRVEKSQKGWRSALIIGAILIFLSVVMGTSSSNALAGVQFAAIGFVVFIFWIVVFLYYRGTVQTQSNLAEFDGEYFYFSNEEFHRQFSLLNPNLVWKPEIEQNK